jgi:hypothetical protein
MGKEAGGEAAGQYVVTILALVAVLVGAAVTAAGRERSRAAMLVPVAAAAWMTAHFYAFDSYYLPSLTRFSENGGVESAWVYAVAAAAVAVALMVWLRPRLGLALTPFVLIVCAVTALAQGVGH